MAVLDNNSADNFLLDYLEEYSDASLQEERRRTGRCLAVGIVIFLVTLGLYHAILYDSPNLSALLGAALIMFLYLFWVFYASQRKKRMMKLNEEKLQRDLQEVVIPQIIQTKQKDRHKESHRHHHKHHYKQNVFLEEEEEERQSSRPTLGRSYSIG